MLSACLAKISCFCNLFELRTFAEVNTKRFCTERDKDKEDHYIMPTNWIDLCMSRILMKYSDPLPHRPSITPSTIASLLTSIWLIWIYLVSILVASSSIIFVFLLYQFSWWHIISCVRCPLSTVRCPLLFVLCPHLYYLFIYAAPVPVRCCQLSCNLRRQVISKSWPRRGVVSGGGEAAGEGKEKQEAELIYAWHFLWPFCW